MVFGIGEGNVDIILEKSSFKAGEQIKGKVVLDLKGPKKAKELRIILKAEKEGYRDGKRTKRTIHSAPITLDQEKEYPAGKKEYDFEFTLPTQGTDPGDGLVGDVVKAISFISGSGIKWYLDASLDVPMSMDISKKIQLNVV